MNASEVEPKMVTRGTGVERHNLARYLLLILGTGYVIVSLYLIFETRSRLSAVTTSEDAAILKLEQRQIATEDELKTSNQALKQQLGVTERGLHAAYAGTTAELRQSQKAFERRMQDEQNQAAEQVTVEVASVRTELNGAKNDIAATRSDLDSTKLKLDRAVGDLTGQSSLIARTREELDELRHRGDRNYYEFSLYKGEHPSHLSTVALQLKKVDVKKGKFTLSLVADDRVVEKKDRGVAEPLQFYTGRNRQLYEVVIFTVEKNKVTGYLSTPKSPGLTASR
ncbi:MAG TPA: hypothetical protein VMG82_04945 [Candidatus Sulfotelmatobacter sp.]|nr:hypothetical protein [Candidatus Sulfotelmatobacter sp.]